LPRELVIRVVYEVPLRGPKKKLAFLIEYERNDFPKFAILENKGIPGYWPANRKFVIQNVSESGKWLTVNDDRGRPRCFCDVCCPTNNGHITGKRRRALAEGG
jgi:hypothetical protein